MTLANTHDTALTRYGFDTEELDTLKRTIAVGCSDAELALFARVCERTGLDPFAKQIYPVMRFNKKAGRDVMVIQTAIDGYRVIAGRSGHYRGPAGTYWCGPDGVWKDVWLESTPPAAAKVGVRRDDFAEPLWAVARFDSYKQTFRDGNLSGLWATMPDVMIAKCAEALALRRAFPNDLSGIYTSEEMGQADSIDVPVIDAAVVAPALKPADPVAAADDVADLVAALNGIADHQAKVAAKQEFMTKFGPPDKLRQSQLEDAQTWVADKVSDSLLAVPVVDEPPLEMDDVEPVKPRHGRLNDGIPRVVTQKMLDDAGLAHEPIDGDG